MKINLNLWLFLVILGVGLNACEQTKPTSSSKNNKNNPPNKDNISTQQVPLKRNADIINADKVELRADQIRPGTSDILSFVADHGIESISLIFNSLEGSERDEAMFSAVSILVHTTGKVELLKKISKLPPGDYKFQLLKTAVERGQGIFDESFMRAVSDLDYPKEQKAALDGFRWAAKINSLDEFNKSIECLNGFENLERRYLEYIQDGVLLKYSRSFIEKDSNQVITSIQQLPDKFQSRAIEMASSILVSSDGPGYLKLASSFEDSPELASIAYSSGLSQIGRSNPNVGMAMLQQVPENHRNDAIRGFVEGWLREDPKAASEWAAKQQGIALQTAAREIVGYLESKNSPQEEIKQWKSLY